jgi:hypothetical protein
MVITGEGVVPPRMRVPVTVMVESSDTAADAVGDMAVSGRAGTEWSSGAPCERVMTMVVSLACQ